MKPLRILVIEDEQGIREVVKTALEPTYDVIQASHGEEGLHQANLFKPSLILLDIRMPGMDGLAVLAKLKAHEATRRIPVIIISVEGDAEWLLESQRAGAADHLIKPFQIEQLRRVIRRHLL